MYLYNNFFIANSRMFVLKRNAMITQDPDGSNICNCKNFSIYKYLYISIFEITILKFKYIKIKYINIKNQKIWK